MSAGLADGIYGSIQVLARDIVPGPDNTDGAAEAHAVLWLGDEDGRKGAFPASLDITGSGVDLTPIPAATQFRRSDGAIYETSDDLFFSTTAGFFIEANSVAKEGEPGFGASGNTVPGTILTLVQSIPGLQPDWTVDGAGIDPIGGGADEETVPALSSRTVDRAQNPPRGGAKGDYVAFARAVEGVSFAWEREAEGVVIVYIVRESLVSPIPDAELVARVQEEIDRQAPLGATVLVLAPTSKVLGPSIEVSPFTPEVVSAVTASLDEVIALRAVPGQIFRISHLREAVSIAQGEVDHEFLDPVADVVVADGELLTLGTPTITEKT